MTLSFGGDEAGVYAVSTEGICHVTDVFEVHTEDQCTLSLVYE